ncbi:MAG: hypothetical protein HYV09_29525 [Deltaproteobacteria bacterium]|nr:hypothetical protein [Deltaproteobacteria bacterium]
MAHPDYEELLAAFAVHGVRYLIVGAHAVAFHARPRATKDLDVFVAPTRANQARLRAALTDFFGGEPPEYALGDISSPDTVVQLGVAPVRVDLIFSLEGVPRFADAWKRRADARFGAVPAHYLGLSDLVAAKEAANRAIDRADLAALRRVRARTHRRRRPSS